MALSIRRSRRAQLLFRIGFGILCIALPLTAIVSRRALVVVAPIGVAVLVSAALMMKARSGPIRRLSAALASPAGLAGLFLLGWSALSLAWTPYPGPGAERLLRLAAGAVLAMGAVLALPERMRASNLYLGAVARRGRDAWRRSASACSSRI